MFHNRFFLSICYSTSDSFIHQTALLYYCNGVNLMISNISLILNNLGLIQDNWATFPSYLNGKKCPNLPEFSPSIFWHTVDKVQCTTVNHLYNVICSTQYLTFLFTT